LRAASFHASTLLSAAACAIALADTAAPAAPPRTYAVSDLDVGNGASSLRWGRRNADERLDLFVVTPGAVKIWELTESGYAAAPSEIVRLPDEPCLIDYGDVAGGPGDEIVLLARQGVLCDATDASKDGDPSAPVPGYRRLVVAGGIPLPLESVAAPFLRDINGDGRVDVIVPLRQGYDIYLAGSSGLEKAVSLEGEQRVRVDAGGPGVLDPLELEIHVPHLRFKDLNGDGRLDLVARSRDKTRSYLQGAKGFDPKPSYELDLARFREGDAAKGQDRGSPAARLLGGNAIRVHEVDVDGDGIQDYLIAAGQFLRVYFGTREGVDFTRPHTMLKLSTELQGVGSFDVDGDRKLDLVALKFELPGLPKLIAAYFVPMSLDFEVLGYRNEGGRRFSRRPDWRNTISIGLPPLRQVMEDFDAIADRFLEAASKRGRFSAGDVDGDGTADAVFYDDDSTIRAYFTPPGRPRPGEIDLGKILFDAQRNRWALDELLDYIARAGLAAARAEVGGRQPDLEVPAGPGCESKEAKLDVLDLNGDRAGDFVIRCGEGKIRIVLSRA